MNSKIKNSTIIKLVSIFIISAGVFYGIFNTDLKDKVLGVFSTEKKTTQAKTNKKEVDQIYLNQQSNWVNAKLATMSLDEKIGQLFMVAAYSNQSEADYRKVDALITDKHIGGVIFFQGTPEGQAILTNRYQNLAKTPLMVGIDGEWGLSMRLKNTLIYPKSITLGALSDTKLVEDMGQEIGKELKRMGVHINFAPVADINTNPKNPVINYRSFGEQKFNVAEKAAAYARGMQKENVMACAKHFPGHGDTGSDSHYSLPVVKHTKERLQNIELYPFKRMIEDSVAAVMTAHLYIPAFESKENTPSSVSTNIVQGILREQLGFKGLTFTDAMNMAGLAKHYTNGNAELAAFKAGNDILLFSSNINAGISKIKQALTQGSISESQLDEKVTRILQAKYWAGLNKKPEPISLINLNSDLNTKKAKDLINKIYQEAATIVKDEENIIPIVNLDTNAFVSLSIGASRTYLQTALSKYTEFNHHTLAKKPTSSSQWAPIVAKIPVNSQVIVSIHGLTNSASNNYGVTKSTIDCIRAISKKAKVIITVFGNPYSLKSFEEFPNIICGYEDRYGAQIGVAELIFGVFSSTSKLPITAENRSTPDYGFPHSSPKLGRLTLGSPESVGMKSAILDQIEGIALEGINQRAYPGCQVLVARHGKVVYNRSFGFYTYNRKQPVTDNTIYDLASVTKVAATLQAIMKLNENGWLELNAKVSEYIPELIGSNKENMTIGKILMHEAGLKSFQAFWVNTKTGTTFKPEYYSFKPKDGYIQVADQLYIKEGVKQEVLQWIRDSDLTKRRDRQGGFRYLYSDLGLILLQEVVERITNQPIDEFVEQNIYLPLGMTTTGYNPLKKFDKSQIAPTENDLIFRKRQIQGTVHDPNAALLGGVAGHAGLFSNAWDLAKLFEMNLQNGYYGGRQYLYPNTVTHFATSFTNKSHRGLGWNKPAGITLSSIANNASKSTYGHTGFTGAVVWVDPDRDLIFIMLSNRVYPSGNNRALMRLETRKRIHEVINSSIVS